MRSEPKLRDEALVLLYYPDNERRGRELSEILKREISPAKLKIEKSLENLIDKLQAPSRNKHICVLVMARRQDLSRILSLKNLLLGVRLILVLPDHSEVTIALAHRLHPRFLTYITTDFNPVVSVIKRLIKADEG
jgi:hypothetical protein